MPVPARTDAVLVRLELDPTGPEEARARLLSVAADGSDREVAAWTVRAPYGDAVMARSPDGERVGVLVGGELRTIALSEGMMREHVAGRDVAAPVPGVSTAPEAIAEALRGAAGPARLVWIDGLARAVWPEGNAPLHAPLDAGWSIELEGSAEVDPQEFTGHHFGGPGAMFFVVGEPAPEDLPALGAEAQRLTDEAWVEDERRSRQAWTFRLVARHAGSETVVHHEERRPRAGVSVLHWPPVVTPHGLLLRRAVSAVEQGGTYHEMQHPWLVAHDGEVRTLPFELGVGPRDVLPDGRLLQPGYDALWWDGSDEAPTALALDGATESLRIGPRAREDDARPHRVLREAFPELPVAWPPPPDDEGWHVEDVRVDAAAAEVVLLLVEGFPDSTPSEEEDPTAWAVVAVPLSGDGPVRGIAHGVRPAGAGTSFAL